MPNGPSRNGTISHDQRIARVAAYESDASNIVEGDTNGVTDVFMVRRNGPWGRNGTPWAMGGAELVSVGLGGVPANGPSYKPTIDGSSHNSPYCIGFISEASNLVGGDTNGVADAFVRDLRTGKITRVSVNSAGKQANGPSSEITVDGDCERVAFTSNATNLSLRSSKLSWRSAATSGGAGKRQVFVHIRSGKKLDKGFKGMTFVASANRSGRAANGDSYEPAFARAGKAVAFTSSATNLTRGDRSTSRDVYLRSFERVYKRFGKKRKGQQVLEFNTRLVSSTGRGKSGNGESFHPSVTDDGRFVAYETHANNLLARDGNGVSDVARADLKKKRVKQDWVSKAFEGIGNGASSRPVISGAGEFVLFDSDSSNFRPSSAVQLDANGVRDMFLWNAPTRNVSLESRNWDNKYLKTASMAPATSSRGNYVLFESADPNIDQLIQNLTGNGQVYMRYLGPK